MIEVSREPNSLNTHRYDVHLRGRSTHGYRRTPAEARAAATEDADLMGLCAHVEAREDSGEQGAAPRQTRNRREQRHGEDE